MFDFSILNVSILLCLLLVFPLSPHRRIFPDMVEHDITSPLEFPLRFPFPLVTSSVWSKWTWTLSGSMEKCGELG
jgi:hypothetical protein